MDFIQRTYTAHVADSHVVSENALWARSGYGIDVPARRCCNFSPLPVVLWWENSRVYGLAVESRDGGAKCLLGNILRQLDLTQPEDGQDMHYFHSWA